MRHFLFILTAALAGFTGGFVGVRAANGPETIIRARSFELVDEEGRVVSFWGIDQRRQAVLAFGARGFALDGVRPKGDPAGLRNPNHQLAVFGLQDNDSPMLTMSGVEGKPRIRLLLSKESKPKLIMEDEFGPRVLLGIEEIGAPGLGGDNWGSSLGRTG